MRMKMVEISVASSGDKTAYLHWARLLMHYEQNLWFLYILSHYFLSSFGMFTQFFPILICSKRRCLFFKEQFQWCLF